MKAALPVFVAFLRGGDTMTSKHLNQKERYGLGVATFAGSCFWCMEVAFRLIKGVVGVVSGYAGGEEPNPSYGEVASGRTGHREAVQVTFDVSTVSFEQLLEVFWQSIDPTDEGGQFADRGSPYIPAIFFHSDDQKKLAEQSKQALAASDRFDQPLVVEIIPFSTFYPAEEKHQGYHRKHPLLYRAYEKGSGRKDFLKKMWHS